MTGSDATMEVYEDAPAARQRSGADTEGTTSMPSHPTPAWKDRFSKTETPCVYRYDGERGTTYTLLWREAGARKRRTFPTYEAAVAFKRDHVDPYKDRAALPPTMAAPKGGGGWVYFLQSKGDDRRVKIGYSTAPSRRISDLSTAHPHGLELVALIPGSKAVERRLHDRFASRRLGREWFSREVLADLTQIMVA